MRIYRGHDTVQPQDFKNPYCTLGVFDGVHLGHQYLITELKEWAGDDGEVVAITFDEHPLTVLGRMPPVAITSLEHRLVLLERAGLDAVLVVNFDREMADWPPEEFVQRVLVDHIGCRHFLLGFDAALGKGAKGNAEYLHGLPDLGVDVRSARPFRIAGQPVSSTDVRTAIMKGELYQVAQFLGRPPSLYGEVIHGDGRGRKLGFPTANLNLFHSAAPPHGVYIAEVIRIEDPHGDRNFTDSFGALINIGRRPTFLSPDDPLDYSRYYNEQLDKIEIYIHEFDEDIYGCKMETVLHKKVRDERRFPNIDELVAQITMDRDELVRWMETR